MKIRRPLWCRVEDWICTVIAVGLLVSAFGLAYSLGELHASSQQVVQAAQR